MHQMIFFSFLFFFMCVLTFPFGLILSVSGEIFFVDWLVMTLGGTPITFSLVLDNVSFLFSSSVFFISGNVCWFSIGYLRGEAFIKRFSYLVFFFVLSMNMLIYSGNLVTVLLGWDGLGLTSFLLVIYYQNSYSLGAGLITVLTNRLGDVGLIMSVALLLNGGHWGISEVVMNPFISLLVMLGAVTKSAQFPFSSWLPMAMAAPTPVSALVHSSTLVTAGVYLLIRFYPSMKDFDIVMSLLLMLSALTMVLAGLAAFTEMDFKKIIAYSTLSQLGVMMVGLGLGSPLLSFFHLISHAMFKALMFICAGTYIYYHKHGQDLRVMGNLSNYLPVTQLGLVLSNLGLCGFPFLSGFYSKDPIYEFSVSGGYNLIVVFFMSFGLLLTSVYSIRAMLISQMGPSNQVTLNSLNNNLSFFKAPVYMLGGLSMFWGAALNWVLLPPVFISPISFLLGVLPLILFVAAILFYWVWCLKLSCYSSVNYDKVSYYNVLHEGSITLWFVGFMSSQYVIKGVVHFGDYLVSTVDQGWVEEITGQGAFNLSNKLMKHFLILNTKSFPLLVMVGGVVFMVMLSL